MKIHITKQGETIEGVANKYCVSNQDLIGINPHLSLTSDLVPGLKLKIPDVARTEKANEHIEKFYPNLEHEKKLKEQATPIGLKPFPATHPEVTAATAHHTPPTPEYPTPWAWGHLNEHTASLSPEVPIHHPWNPGHCAPGAYDTRAIIPPLPYYASYPSYPYPYAYPSYGHNYGLPFLGFGPGYGYGQGWHGPGYGYGQGWHGPGYGYGHFGGHHRLS